MRKMLCAAALVSIALLGAGCKKSPSIVGKWTGAMQSQNAEFEFKADNTMVITAKQGPISLAFNGDYKVDGENMTLTMKDVKIDGAPKGIEDMVKASVKSQIGKEQKSKIKFVSDDEVSITTDTPGAKAGSTSKAAGADGAAPGSTISLKRVKEGS